MAEAEYKSEGYDLLRDEFEKLTHMRDELLKERNFFEAKFLETSNVLKIIEEERKNDQ